MNEEKINQILKGLEMVLALLPLEDEEMTLEKLKWMRKNFDLSNPTKEQSIQDKTKDALEVKNE